MKAMTVDKFGGSETMHYCDMPKPEPKAHEVQIHVAYTSVNPVDWKIREGYLRKLFEHRFPFILGWDAAGVVSAVGSEVSTFREGDEVYAYCRKSTVHMGTYAEFVCVDAHNVALKPQKLSFAEAAAIPLVGLTAWQSLFDSAKLKSDQHILIHAGAGGVGSIAIQLAKNAGATIYTTASKRNEDYVHSLGADYFIDYENQNFVQEIKKLRPEGIDVVFDCVGYQTLHESFEVIKKDGRLVSIVNRVDPKEAISHNVKGDFVFVTPNGEQLREIAHLFDEGKIHPPEIYQMNLEEAKQALEENKKGHTRGKIVLKVPS